MTRQDVNGMTIAMQKAGDMSGYIVTNTVTTI